jgi:transcriptional regulator with XRE-family HTH domain
MKVNTGSPEREKIRRLRLRAGMSQESLAQRVGVTTHTIWRLENGPTFNPRFETLRALAKALGIPLKELLDV